jgi:hypothetical protein
LLAAEPPELVGSSSVLMMRFEVKSMFGTFKSMRRDYPTMAAMAAIVFGTFVIGGIAFTYENRPPEWLNAVAHLFDHRQLPADL